MARTKSCYWRLLPTITCFTIIAAVGTLVGAPRVLRAIERAQKVSDEFTFHSALFTTITFTPQVKT